MLIPRFRVIRSWQFRMIVMLIIQEIEHRWMKPFPVFILKSLSRQKKNRRTSSVSELIYATLFLHRAARKKVFRCRKTSNCRSFERFFIPTTPNLPVLSWTLWLSDKAKLIEISAQWKAFQCVSLVTLLGRRKETRRINSDYQTIEVNPTLSLVLSSSFSISHSLRRLMSF